MDKSEKKRLKEALKEAKRAQKAATKEEKQRKKGLIAKAKEEYNAKRCTYYGVLLRCGKLAAPGTKLCERHAKKEAKREERRREKEKYEKERCSSQVKLFGFFWPLRCNDQVVSGKTLCEYHASQETERLRKEAEYRQIVEKAKNLKVPISTDEDERSRYLKRGYCIYYGNTWWERMWRGTCGEPVVLGSPLCKLHTQENDAILELELRRAQATYWSDIVGDGKQFEKEFADLWHKAGYKVTEISMGADQGVDFIATKGEEKIVVQCKATQSKIGGPYARDLLGTVVKMGADKGVLASIGGFTDNAYDFASGTKIELWGLDRIIKFNLEGIKEDRR